MEIRLALRRFAVFYNGLIRIYNSNVFLHVAYSETYFGTKILFFTSLLHYVIAGERKGYRPNPFFDPTYFETMSGSRRLSEYLTQPHLWYFPTSHHFDSRWYIDTYASQLATTENPLVHFWLKGFEQRNNPCPHFDTTFFARAIARDYVDKKAYAYRYLAAAAPLSPFNVAALERNQAAFYAQISLDVLKHEKPPEKRFLVFLQSGRNMIPDFDPRVTNFDVLVNYYDDSDAVSDKALYVFRQKGTKTTAIRKIMEIFPDLLLSYDAILLLDDDIEISRDQIEELFATQQTHGLDLIQASLTEDSECFYPVLKQPVAGGGVRPVSVVEIMMPVISRRALRECAWVFSEGISGWLVDILLSAEIRKRFGNTIAIAGHVVCVHRRAVDTSNGAFYKFLAEHGISATVEAGKIAIKFGVNDKMTAVSFHVPPVDAPVYPAAL